MPARPQQSIAQGKEVFVSSPSIWYLLSLRLNIMITKLEIQELFKSSSLLHSPLFLPTLDANRAASMPVDGAPRLSPIVPSRMQWSPGQWKGLSS